MGRVYNNPATGDIYVEGSDGGRVWSTERPPVNLLPDSDWLQVSQTIAYPDFSKFVNYAHQRIYNPDNPPPWALSGSGDACQTVTMIVPEDRTLDEIVLGTVPAGVNYIDVRVRLTQTKAPTHFLDQPVPQLIASNNWVHLPGGSCLIEATTIWRRLFEIVLVGNSVRLRRHQSVAPAPADAISRFGGIYSTTGTTADPWGLTGYAVWGWVQSSPGAFMGTQRPGHPAAHIQTKQFSSNNGHDVPTMGAKHPRRSNRCSIDNSSHNFSSTYAGEIVIRPGHIRMSA